MRTLSNLSGIVTPEMAYSVDIERTKIRLANSAESALRVTTIFRLENGEWKIVHQHADRWWMFSPLRPVVQPSRGDDACVERGG